MIIENENKNNLNNFSSHLIFLYSFVVHSVQGKALISGSDCRKLCRQMYCQWKLDTFRLNLLSKFTCILLSELNLLSCQSLYLSWPLSLTHPRVTLAGTKTSCWSPDTLMNRCVHHTHMLHKKKLSCISCTLLGPSLFGEGCWSFIYVVLSYSSLTDLLTHAPDKPPNNLKTFI